MEKTEGKIRYGLIGIGAQGGSYARFLTNAPAPFPGMVCAPCPDNCALGALCDIDPEKEKMCKEQYPDVPFFKDWKDMIASGTVDAIITTVPHYLHHEISIYAMEHGMNVLCEKPAGVRSKDVQKMIACAKAHPEVSFGIMFNQRTNKLYQKIKEIVASGELGEIRRSQWMINSWWRPDSYYQQSAWRATWGGEGGGVLVNQAPHQLDLWQWICGIPVKVFSKNINGCHRDIGVENDVTMLVEFANGATGTFTTCTHDAIGTDRQHGNFHHAHVLVQVILSAGVAFLIDVVVDVSGLAVVNNDLAAVHKEHKSVGINVYNRTIGNIVVGSLLVGTFLNSNALYKQGAVAHIIGFDNFLPGIGKYA